jgi:tRNA dimethylallyltransferase
MKKMSISNKYLIAVVGPTAIGKTVMAIELAKHFGCEIISCDSRQFFKEMNIGTAVPSKEELASVKHHFIHNKSIFENYTVGDFEKEALEKLDMLYKTNNFAVIVGGSGLYVNAVLNGLDDFPEIDPEVRCQIISEYEASGIEYLQKELRRLDPDYYKNVDTGNPQRMSRALEVSIGTGKPYSSFLNQKKNSRDFTPIIIGLEAEREAMYDRINRRVDIMIDEGLIQEAKALYRHKTLNALQTVGYREVFSHLDGDFPITFAIDEIKKNTRRFAKRQMTWFKKTENIRWFDYTAKPSEIINFINGQIKNPDGN